MLSLRGSLRVHKGRVEVEREAWSCRRIEGCIYYEQTRLLVRFCLRVGCGIVGGFCGFVSRRLAVGMYLRHYQGLSG